MTDDAPIKQLLRCQGEFMAYLMAIVRDFDAAEEVFQNAAVVILEGAASGAAIRDFRAWAKEIVRRQALYYLRQRVQAQRHVRPIEAELFEALSRAFLEEDGAAAGREAQALRACLDQLPAPRRRLLALRYETHASFEQIAAAVQSTAAAVQRTLSRVRKTLHDCVRAALLRPDEGR
jgi:RNA polymerase sigma-70 factor (ECF subfamily)